MCSQKMENYQGDLTDIIRATGSIIGGIDDSNTAPVAAEAATSSSSAVPEWQFPTNPINYTTDPAEDFGHPFSHLTDPLLHDHIENPVSGFFNNSNNIIIKPSVPDETAGSSAGGFANGSMKRPASNMFSRMLQISPNAKLPIPLCDSPAAVGSPRGLKGHPPMLISNHDHGLISPNSSKSCLVESSGLQISSPRNTGIKRRKSQAKKVVCIPAPAPVNSRPSGEVVPSDLWAWRKYGQKPIKGSPYPRGYYRCSSSKGCSARKQVERSRNDPNMLVITYTSEHNHPWPTQRNALAGSTRAPPSKNTAGASAKDSTSQNPKEEQKETSTENPTTPPSLAIDATVKEERMDRDFDHNLENMDDPDQFERGFTNSYKPTLPDSNQTEDSFFADLGEIEADSLDMLFTQGFSGDDGREDKTLDPFTFYDWVGNNSTTSSAGAAASNSGAAATTFEEATKKDSL